MKLYGNPLSSATIAVLATLAEKGHSAELVVVDLRKGEHKQPAHLARHPFGVIPVLDDNGFLLYESRAIMRYLDGRLPGPRLVPDDLRQRALMEQWISVEQSYFSPAVGRIFYPLFMGQPPDPQALEKARAEVAQSLRVAEAALRERPYLTGDGLTLAELCWLPFLEMLGLVGQDDLIRQHPRVTDWWQRLRSRASWQKVLAQAPLPTGAPSA